MERARGTPAAGQWPRMALLVNGRARRTVVVDSAEPADYVFQAELPAGACELGVAFLNDAVIGREDRNLILDRITVSPPAGVPPRTADPGDGPPQDRRGAQIAGGGTGSR